MLFGRVGHFQGTSCRTLGRIAVGGHPGYAQKGLGYWRRSVPASLAGAPGTLGGTLSPGHGRRHEENG